MILGEIVNKVTLILGDTPSAVRSEYTDKYSKRRSSKPKVE